MFSSKAEQLPGKGLIFIGTYAHSLEPVQITIEKGILAVLNGVIVAAEKSPGDIACIKQKFPEVEWEKVELQSGQFLCPGFIDLHVHAPQFPNAGLGYDMPLLEWLQKYTYPCEQKYSDVNHAKYVYKSVVEKMLSCGTTTACYFGTIHRESTLELAKAVALAGQRAFIGKVNMNFGCPENYSESLEESLEETKKFIDGVLELKNSLVKPIITPRFAVTCDSKLMTGLSKLAEANSLHIQTHISENTSEVEFVKELFHGKNYTDVYDQAGLLTNRTLLAHGIYLSDSELELIRERGCTVVHCPNSNVSLKSGICKVRRLQKHTVNVGLGTDVSGGYSASMLNCMRSAIDASIVTFFPDSESSPLTYNEVFYMATSGAAKEEISSFNANDSLTDSEIIQKFIYTGDDRNIIAVYVDGVQVKTGLKSSQ
ncbi:hypothetical protein LSTR_LSTR003225 [Laodelphax striatellus]|uniref:Guanine deaminase n=1 Tax=Laodelphax striatellus TaxID=195883 RepID=A0A482XRR8_LAOST|nr:hypothetical protein LSTR_LSTR003225 [Laodelphax striatellus]